MTGSRRSPTKSSVERCGALVCAAALAAAIASFADDAWTEEQLRPYAAVADAIPLRARSHIALMTDKRVRHLPVVEDTKVIGIVSIGDLLKHIISKKDFALDQLEHYIQGRTC
jgi:predicted transcriptional regulator